MVDLALGWTGFVWGTTAGGTTEDDEDSGGLVEWTRGGWTATGAGDWDEGAGEGAEFTRVLEGEGDKTEPWGCCDVVGGTGGNLCSISLIFETWEWLLRDRITKRRDSAQTNR